ncbi:conserved membrane hypothetical protein [Crenothrix polyspora]|uniref:VanZ-like domain-containing protein n=1 Tax=Crenothrix polyspora TaxID=360316 RepID=A0A1R4H8A1_9GAMM|nr:VanZ family protein [Crenothrix polyspora]SJM92464.1 conserved membrane hypothetical protein [Crenothrix polyspora]
MTKYCCYAAVVYLVFVIYGSLVPFDYQNVPWQQALDKFKNIPYLDLGIESRADWIANIVLYIPLAFLWSSALGNVYSLSLRFAGTALVLCLCLLLAVGIEFCQLYFPPRTVSINDLIAESIGTVIGLLTSQIWGRQLLKLCHHLPLSHLLSVKALIKLYLLGYVLLSFFPYDFVTSFAELETKLEGGHDHIFISFDACSNELVRCAVKFLVEIIVLLPAGGLLYLLPHISHKLALAVLVGFFLGVFSEIVQLFLYSGIAQGFSILTRMLGMGLGVIATDWLYKQKMAHWQKRLKPFVLMTTLPYLALVFIINGGWNGAWLTVELASTKLAETHFMPFYYFYYTTETLALVSLISNVGLYMPIGFAFGLWCRATDKSLLFSWVWVGLCGAGLAVLVETEKLFLADKHPDPTDIEIAFMTAAASYVLINKALSWISQDSKLLGNKVISIK